MVDPGHGGRRRTPSSPATPAPPRGPPAAERGGARGRRVRLPPRRGPPGRGAGFGRAGRGGGAGGGLGPALAPGAREVPPGAGGVGGAPDPLGARAGAGKAAPHL